MKVFLIIVAVLALIITLILSLSATLTVVFDNGWHTKIKVLFIEKDIVLSQVLNFILFPDKAAKEAKNKVKSQKEEIKENPSTVDSPQEKIQELNKEEEKLDEKIDDTKKKQKEKQAKPNYFAKLWDEQGIVGMMSFVTNMIESGSAAVTTLFRGFHIYSLYVKIIIGGSDAANIAQDYGMLCSIYYPLKGIILNGMKVDQYDDYIQPDFIAPRNEYEFQLIGSINVRLLVKVLLKAGIVFLKNFIKDK